METIHFCVLGFRHGKTEYSEKEYKIEEIEGIKWIKGVKCFNEIQNLKYEKATLNFAWVTEYPIGTIESKIWCDQVRLKGAKELLEINLDAYLKKHKKIHISDILIPGADLKAVKLPNSKEVNDLIEKTQQAQEAVPKSIRFPRA